MLTLLLDPHDPVLRAPAHPVEGQMWREVPALLAEMRRVLRETQGVGLAAPQVGVPLAVCIIAARKGEWIEAINPKVVAAAGPTYDLVEGCLSLPRQEFKVARYLTVKFEFQNPARRWCQEKLTGLEAQIAQHETDHLKGLLLDRGGLRV